MDSTLDEASSFVGCFQFIMVHFWVSLGLQIAQSRSYLCTLGPIVGIIYILGAPGYDGQLFWLPGLPGGKGRIRFLSGIIGRPGSRSLA